MGQQRTGRRTIRACFAVGKRCGAAAVELALIAPFLAIVAVGLCEMGDALKTEAILTEAARKGCAAASRPGCTESVVTQEVGNALMSAGMPAGVATTTILVNDQPADLTSAKRNDKITITVSVPSAQVRWVRSSSFMGAGSVQAESVSMLKQG